VNSGGEDYALASFEEITAGVRTFAELPATIPADGTYRLRLDPFGGAAGWIEARVRVVSDLSSRLTLGRQTLVRIQEPAQQNKVTFTVPRGAQLSWAIDRSALTSGTLWLDGPYGSVSIAPLAAGSSKGQFYTDPLVAGTYTIRVDPDSWQVGSMQLTVRNTASVAG
jgi:hypothetical protein